MPCTNPSQYPHLRTSQIIVCIPGRTLHSPTSQWKVHTICGVKLTSNDSYLARKQAASVRVRDVPRDLREAVGHLVILLEG